MIQSIYAKPITNITLIIFKVPYVDAWSAMIKSLIMYNLIHANKNTGKRLHFFPNAGNKTWICRICWRV
jgi:hypothetical protein